MRVKDATYSIYDALKALPWRPSYLAAMWILGGELQSLYAAWIGEDEVPLIGSTMELVREVIISGESPQAITRAADLADAWKRVTTAREATHASGGLMNALATFEALAWEIDGTISRHFAANHAVNAAEDRWLDWDSPGPIIVDWNEEADDTSPKAQTLTLFARVVSEVASHQGPEWDPEGIRQQIFGQRLAPAA